MMKIAVIDGQGGGLGCSIIEKLKPRLPQGAQIIALGTNAIATAKMMKAGADSGVSGENAIVWNVYRVDVITGPLGIIIANSMLGELTPKMAEAISSATVPKFLLPVTTCNVEVIGRGDKESLPNLIEQLVEKILQKVEENLSENHSS